MSATTKLDWPAEVPIERRTGYQVYVTPEGEFPRVTAVLKMLGTGTEALIRWAARVEHDACMEAAVKCWPMAKNAGHLSILMANNLGPVRQHQNLLEKAGDIGTGAHKLAAWRIRQDLGLKEPKPVVPEASMNAYIEFESWWRASGLKVLKVEQPVWCPDLRAAGTADYIVEHPDRGVGLLDLKTSKGLYESHHIQCATYAHMTRRWLPVQWAELVKLPKTDQDKFEVVPMGKLYDREVSEEELLSCFKACLTLWETLCRKSA